MAVNRMVATRRNRCKARHHPLCDAPVIISVFSVAASTDQESTFGFDNLELDLEILQIVFIALGALEKRIMFKRAAMQERNVAGIDAAFHRLQIITFLIALRNESALGTDSREFEFRQFRLQLRRAHVSPKNTATLD